MKTDTLVVGAGLAGVCVALQTRGPVLLLSPNRLGEDCASDWAQGGIAAAFDAGDHPQSHASDTIKAGGGIVDAESARLLSENIADAVCDLADIGVPFDRTGGSDGGFTLGREAAHSHARIVRVGGDGAGHAIMKTLVQALRRCKHVRVLEGFQARDLLLAQGRVVGVLAKDGTGKAVHIRARHTVLACGGVGQLYRFTTNPEASRGEGIAMAARAGAALADMEFVQFHPTAINTGGDPLPLATEALRGDGAVLLDRHGTRFLRRVHPSGELAPRDVVARAIHRERKLGPVFLDVRGVENLPARFTALLQACRTAGIDPCREAVPVLPAAHYHMGGIAINANGRTSLPGLWACGEVASSGCHGANRLAGNSLGEAVVFAKRIAQDCNADGADFVRYDLPCMDDVSESNPAEEKDIERLRDLMSRYVGIERDESGLHFACRKLLQWKRESRPGGRLSNMSTAALLIAVSALQRRASRGCHFRPDAATASLPPRRSVITLVQAEDIAAQIPSLPEEQPLSL